MEEKQGQLWPAVASQDCLPPLPSIPAERCHPQGLGTRGGGPDSARPLTSLKGTMCGSQRALTWCLSSESHLPHSHRDC